MAKGGQRVRKREREGEREGEDKFHTATTVRFARSNSHRYRGEHLTIEWRCNRLVVFAQELLFFFRHTPYPSAEQKKALAMQTVTTRMRMRVWEMWQHEVRERETQSNHTHIIGSYKEELCI